jgi:hypothetical protein
MRGGEALGWFAHVQSRTVVGRSAHMDMFSGGLDMWLMLTMDSRFWWVLSRRDTGETGKEEEELFSCAVLNQNM